MSLPANFPASLDALANPTATTNRDDPGFELDLVISRIHDILEAIEAKLGIGASSPGASAAVLRRSAPGASAWGPVVPGDLAGAGAGDANTVLATLGGTTLALQKVVAAMLTGAGAGDANSVLRTTGGTTVAFGKVTAADMSASLLGLQLLNAFGPLSGQAASLSFTSIPQTYRALRLVYQGRSSVAGASPPDVKLWFNGNTAAAYADQGFQATATGVSAFEHVAATSIACPALAASGNAATCAGHGEIDVPNYTGTAFAKYCGMLGGTETSFASGGQTVRIGFGVFFSTGAITQIDVAPVSGNWDVGSVAALYGVL